MISLNVEKAEQMPRLSGLLKALRNTVRDNDFKVAQHLRCQLAGQLAGMKQSIDKGLRDQLEILFEISGQWVRGIGNRHDNKALMRQSIEQMLRKFRRLAARRSAADQKVKERRATGPTD
jgi:hypothetical protein